MATKGWEIRRSAKITKAIIYRTTFAVNFLTILEPAMAFNSSLFMDYWCSFITSSNSSKRTSVYYQVTLTTCVVISLLAPLAVTGNAFIFAAIWKNPSLRTPSYVLLAGLALTDFFTGLLSQPLYVLYRMGKLPRNSKMFCLGGVITQSFGYYFSSLTVVVMAMIAVERWLHMSRRSLLSVRGVVILYITSAVLLIVFFACYMYILYYTSEISSPFLVIFVFGAAFYFSITVLAYYKVYRIIRHHQSQVQTNENAIDIEKYKKSVFTVLYILVVFLLSCVPSVCCIAVVSVVDLGSELSLAAVDACTVITFSSSSVNPLLYCWRIKEMRHSVKAIVRKLCCKKYEEEG